MRTNMQGWKMRDLKIRHQTAGVENAGLESAGNDNNAVESFHATLRRRVKVAHPNLCTFLGHLQRTTTDCETDIARLNSGMAIRRSKKHTNLVNEATCISHFDSGACSSYAQ